MRSIGIGETLSHIIGKAICSATRTDIESLCGVDQLCGGIKSGIEEAIHAMNDLHLQHITLSDWGFLLVDASNAFNSLNPAALLWNVHVCGHTVHVSSSILPMVRLCWLFEILTNSSTVGKGGDSLPMFLYAVGTLPLISSLKRLSLWTQMWYADDASACGRFVHIRQWFDLLLQRALVLGTIQILGSAH